MEFSSACRFEPKAEGLQHFDPIPLLGRQPLDHRVDPVLECLLALAEERDRLLESFAPEQAPRAAARVPGGLDVVGQRLHTRPVVMRLGGFLWADRRNVRIKVCESRFERPEPIPLIVRHVEENVAPRGIVQPDERLPGGRLPASRLPDQTKDLPALHVEGNPVHGPNVLRLFSEEAGDETHPNVKPNPQISNPKKRYQSIPSVRWRPQVARCEMTERSWEIRIMDRSSSFCSFVRSSRIWAWIMTSKAVTGSSAMMILGRQARAIAIITR